MTLRRRLDRLEARRAPAARDDSELVRLMRDDSELMARLLKIEAHVVASGDASDRPDAPPIERAVRRYLRGEADPADALRDLVAGRWP